MEEAIDTALLFKQIKEKVIRDGDDQGKVTEEIFENELRIIRRRSRSNHPNDTPLEHEIRNANSICAHFWHKNGINKAYVLFPDAFDPRSPQKASEVKNEKDEKKPVVASESSSQSTTMIAGVPLHDWLILKQGDPDTAKELMEVWKAKQAPPPIVSSTLIAGIPLHDWLALKKGDPETAKELMDDWKAKQAEKKAAALAEKKTEDTGAKRKSSVKREGDLDSDVDSSSIIGIGSTLGSPARPRKKRC